ncbi:cell-cycle control medial ring component [Boeremia exigua]|uniref:cell-cycle control medial ring component n=1 Tax=Boeremia exigua TaxID=749465 RepID=UPI001E8E4360|nr:cell-cycle control medial ring component [Boeremia exigua]KAH6622233.1 cell-cycle control medial ring component [Boeremia exigua]
MSEVTFCKTFLGAIDSRPVKLSSDYVSDARTYSAMGVPILPRLPQGHPQRPNPKTAANASTATINISLKPMKPTNPTLPLSAVDPSKTSVYDLKSQYASSTSIPAAKIKILYKKKPVTDSKLVSEVIGTDAGNDVEFSVMVMGGATAGASTPSAESPVQSPAAVAPSESDKGLAGANAGANMGAAGGAAAVGPSGKEVVATEEFWGDLKNFVLQRIKDEQEGDRLVSVFRQAWEADR